jgi:hypothetical protein
MLLNSNNGIVFGQDNGISPNTKIGAIKKPLNNKDNGVRYMLVCGMWYVICGMLVCWYEYVICGMLICDILVCGM